jgi:RsiW-degrading membrane proteinase PrsW (M82 family)
LKPDFSVCLAVFVVIALLNVFKYRATLRRPPKSVWVWTVSVRVGVASSISVAWPSVFVPEPRLELLLDSVSEDMAQP